MERAGSISVAGAAARGGGGPDAARRADTLAAFDSYTFTGGDELRVVAVTIAWGRYDRLLPHGRQAPQARALPPWACHTTLATGHVPFFDDTSGVPESSA